MIKDYETKQQLIKNGHYLLYKKASWVIHFIDSSRMMLAKRIAFSNDLGIKIDQKSTIDKLHEVDNYSVKMFDNDSRTLSTIDYDMANLIIDGLTKNDFRVCYNMRHAETRRKKRLKDYIQWLIDNYQCVFLTLTFNDETLKKNKLDSLQQKVCRYLNDATGGLYVANVDYGKKKERIHYHAICPVGLDYSKWHKNGAIKGKKVVVPNSAAMGAYIAKFQNHATKETTHNARTIYGKALKTIMQEITSLNMINASGPLAEPIPYPSN